MNRFRIFDVLESRWLHIGYDTKSSATRAANKMRKAAGDYSRYRVVDQQRPIAGPASRALAADRAQRPEDRRSIMDEQRIAHREGRP